MCKVNLGVVGGNDFGETFAPFDEGEGGFVEEFFEAEAADLFGGVEAVEVGVVDLDGIAIFVDQGEGGAGDFVGGGGTEAFDDAFGEGGFAGARSPMSSTTPLQLRGETAAEGASFFVGRRFKALDGVH